MGKYDPLGDYLRNLPNTVHSVTRAMPEIEGIIGSSLPPAAKRWRQFWANSGDRARAWLDAGWKVSKVDFHQHSVTFERVERALGQIAPDRPIPPNRSPKGTLHVTPSIHSLIERALAEDLGPGDVTTDSLIPDDATGGAVIIAKAPGIIAGLEVALEVFRRVDPSLRCHAPVADGSTVAPGDVVAEVEGRVKGILKAERVALNLLQRLSGIATETSRYVKAIEGTRARILDTRKTTPGLRDLEKYAVRTGGGRNHRHNLSDGILIKDNHIATLRAGGFTLGEVVRRARSEAPHSLRVEVEVETVEEAREALEAHADVLLLDNMSPKEMREVVSMVQGRCLLEASGGINLESVRAVAETGVDLISVGALTHSVRALDLSLEMR